jgi:hypothetical protein
MMVGGLLGQRSQTSGLKMNKIKIDLKNKIANDKSGGGVN